MKVVVVVAALLLAWNSPAFADQWQPENGYGDGGWWNWNWNNDEDHGPYRHAEGYEGHPTLFGGYEEKIWDGRCRIERKWEGDGEYREERECHRHW
jgi:hypothetical protein